MTGGRMGVRNLDVHIMDGPITSISDTYDEIWQAAGAPTYGYQGDIDFRTFLEGHEYNHVFVFAPIRDYVLTTAWGGLNGPHFSWQGKTVYYSIINNIFIDTPGGRGAISLIRRCSTSCVTR